jgi:tripartite-type tricarboxylate transporter receptor subunit TctC
MNAPSVRERFVTLGTEPVISSPEELARFFVSEEGKWGDLIKRLGIKITQ